jgi:hypothetical protein
MGTTDNFDSAAAATAVATSTFPVLLTANAGAKNHTLDMMAAFNGRYRYFTIEGNLGTLSSLGTSTTVTANQTYYADVFIPETGKVLTGIGWLNGTTATTDRAIVSLYSSAGTLLANSTLASNGTLIATSNVFQQAAFTATYTILKPGRYWIGYQQSGTTATPRTIATATWVNVMTGSAAGALGVATASITPPTTFTADTGPVAYVY